MDDDEFWVGQLKDGDSMWVFDPKMKHEDDSMVYAFWVTPARMQEYSKAQLKSVLVTVRNVQRRKAIDNYVRWKTLHGATFLQDELIRMQQSPEEALRRKKILETVAFQEQERRKEAIDNHQRYLAKYGNAYNGVSVGVIQQPRNSHCYSCSQPLDSSLHLKCNACGWMICYCGACGCSYAQYKAERI